jgi:FkbM family methyltransferase
MKGTKKMNLSEIKVGDKTIYFRDGTSDAMIINNNLYCGQRNWKPEYTFPDLPLNPEIIFDIGANIGITTLVIANKYPYATVYAFEPEAENYSILQKNVEGFDRIKAFNFGLSNETKGVSLNKSDDPLNYGGYTTFDVGAGEKHQDIQVRSISEFMSEYGIDKIDLVKIDCEGAEYDILTTVDLANISWIEGECHGIKDYELLGHIAKTHELGISKPLGQRNFNFQGLNKKWTRVK